MAEQLYTVKVKNTFLEVEDDITYDLSFDEDEGLTRQVTEPVPPTTRLLDIHLPFDIPKRKTFVDSASSHNTDYSEALEESTASSEHEPKATEPFQPECEPELTYDGNEMVRQVTEEICWNIWSDKQWEPGVGHCAGDPYVHTIAVDGLLDCAEISANRSTSQQKQNDSARANMKTQRRHKRESLIDVAARKQKQELRKAKQQAKRQSQQPAPETQQSHVVRGDVPKSNLTKFCRQCGGKVQQDFRFCRFCGVAV
jgi:hypothetical protein